MAKKKTQQQTAGENQESPENTINILTRREFIKKTAITIGALTFIGIAGKTFAADGDNVRVCTPVNTAFCPSIISCVGDNSGGCGDLNLCYSTVTGKCANVIKCVGGNNDVEHKKGGK